MLHVFGAALHVDIHIQRVRGVGEWEEEAGGLVEEAQPRKERRKDEHAELPELAFARCLGPLGLPVAWPVGLPFGFVTVWQCGPPGVDPAGTRQVKQAR